MGPLKLNHLFFLFRMNFFIDFTGTEFAPMLTMNRMQWLKGRPPLCGLIMAPWSLVPLKHFMWRKWSDRQWFIGARGSETRKSAFLLAALPADLTFAMESSAGRRLMHELRVVFFNAVCFLVLLFIWISHYASSIQVKAAGDPITSVSVCTLQCYFWDVMSPTLTSNDDTSVPECVAVH